MAQAKEKTKPETKLQAERDKRGVRTVVADSVAIDTITPRQIRNLLLEAEGGDLAAQAELFEKMEEKDGELDAHLRTRKTGVARLKFDIQPADESPQAARAAALCRSVLADLPELRRAVFDLLDAIPKGFSVQEIAWRTGADGWAPAQLIWRPQRWFTVGDDGQTLMLRDMKGGAVELNPLNFIVHRVRARSGFCARTGLLRSCVRAFVVRHFSWKDWMSFAEVYGMPPRLGRLREGVPWDSEEARQLWQAVRSLGMDAAAVVREGNQIEVLDSRAAGEGEIFERILERASKEMTLAILGQLLTSRGEQGGSYALGEVHNQVRWDLLESDAAVLEETLGAQLLRPLVRLNLGEGFPAPRWHFAVEKPGDLEALARTVKTLSEAGLKIPARWAYQKFGIPEPARDEAVLAGDGRSSVIGDQ